MKRWASLFEFLKAMAILGAFVFNGYHCFYACGSSRYSQSFVLFSFISISWSPYLQSFRTIKTYCTEYCSCYSCRSNIDRTRLTLGASRERAREQRKLGTQFTPSVVACLKATNNSTEIVTSSWTMWVDFLRAGQERNPNAAPCFLGMTEL